MRHNLPGEAEVLARVVAWAEQEAGVRALILTSSRTNPQAPLDLLSDYDVMVVVADIGAFAQDDRWLEAFGRPLVQFRDTDQVEGLEEQMRLVLYADGTKIDYMVWPVALLQRVGAASRLPDVLDVGYRVLLDKDGLTQGLPAPTYTAHIPPKPTEQEYLALIAEFWWEISYVAKNLWRDELIAAKYSFDFVMKFQLLRKLLEWRSELDHDWSLKPGSVGRGLKRHLPPDLWTAFAGTYVGPDSAENWQALFQTTALLRRVAVEVGTALGYAYPDELDQQMTAYLQGLRTLAHE